MLAFFKVFITVLLAEVGDKTNLATMGFAATMSRWTVFAASSIALIVACLIGVLVGGWFNGRFSPQWIDAAAGALFVGIGLFKLIPALKLIFFS